MALAATVGADAATARRAAELAKCDLLTGLVGEFPELQGTMGALLRAPRRRAGRRRRGDGASSICRASPATRCPATRVGTALALADKLDTIVGIFAIGQKPSGTKDPFALRRLALGVLRIVLEKRLELDLATLAAEALSLARADIATVAAGRAEAGKAPAAAATGPVGAEVYDYVFERLRAYYLESGAGITTEMFDAVLDRRPPSPLDFDARLRALGAFLQLPDAAALASANKRIANILRKAEGGAAPTLEDGLLALPEERALAGALQAMTLPVEALLSERDYRGALQMLATLRPEVDAFFDKVMVMAEDRAVRANRLHLLASVQRLFLEVADLSRLPG